ncbi:MAG: LPS assembly lipoprotein LptE [Omnitrophica bacterium]|nr:LPS assembly lipoprotein LptE [Candidatus Omnitrophota bacterium]
MRHARPASFFVGLLLIALCGCGYTTRSVVRIDEPSIYVENFLNNIDTAREISDARPYYAYRPAIESDITREVINKFLLDGNYQIEGPKSAHFLLKGELVSFERQPLRYDANDNVTEYRLSVVVNMKLHDLYEKETVWKESDFAGETTYRTSGALSKTESAAIQEAIEDLAQRIVERTVEDW